MRAKNGLSRFTHLLSLVLTPLQSAECISRYATSTREGNANKDGEQRQTRRRRRRYHSEQLFHHKLRQGTGYSQNNARREHEKETMSKNDDDIGIPPHNSTVERSGSSLSRLLLIGPSHYRMLHYTELLLCMHLCRLR